MENKADTVPVPSISQSPKRNKTQRYIKVYFRDTEELQHWADRAAGAGFRRGGLPVQIKKPHGFASDFIYNTDGISKYLKDCEEKVATANELSRLLKVLLRKDR